MFWSIQCFGWKRFEKSQTVVSFVFIYSSIFRCLVFMQRIKGFIINLQNILMLNYELAFELWLQWIQPARLMDYYSLNTRQEGFTSILNKERVPWGGVAYNGPCIPWVWEPFVNLTFNLKHQMSLSPPLILMHRYLLYRCWYHVLVSNKILKQKMTNLQIVGY